MKSIERLQALLDSGEFHHATYRDIGKLWEGLWFYRKDQKAPRGFVVDGCVNAHADADDMEAAHALVRGTGISVGSYGKG